jgi:hypothetical protein
MPDLKEPHYFATELSRDCGFPSTLDEYAALYKEVKPQQKAIGDASVFYMSSPVALPAIRKMMPDAPVIIMLRDFLSQYPSYHAQMRFIMEEDIIDPEQAWDAQPDRANGKRIPKTCLALPRLEYKRVLSVGTQLEQVYALFPKKKVHLIWFDDFSKDTPGCYDQVLDFLGLEKGHPVDFKKYNFRKEFRSGFIQKMIWRQPPWLKYLTRTLHSLPIIGKFRLSHVLEPFTSKEQKKTALSPEFQKRFLAEMEPQIQILERLTGRDLSSWRKLKSAS